MNYIYNISLNYKKTLQDIYEWNKSDKIIKYNRIPVYKIETNKLEHFKNNRLKIDRKIRQCILTDCKDVVAFKFNKKGILIGKSRLPFDKEEEVIYISSLLKFTSINYKIISKDKVSKYKTITEQKERKYIINTINKINNIDKIIYMFYEYFNIIDNDKIKLIKKIDKNWDKIGHKIYDFLYLTSNN